MSKSRKDIRNLMILLASAIGIAFVAVAIFVYYLGASDTYLVRNILVSPKVLEKNMLSNKQNRFIFNKIEFVRSEKYGRHWGRFAVSQQEYTDFFNLIASQRSIAVLTNEIVKSFDLITPSTLTIYAHNRNNEPVIFQQVQFLDGSDLFRVQLFSEMGQGEWIYFLYPKIYERVVSLFVKDDV